MSPSAEPSHERLDARALVRACRPYDGAHDTVIAAWALGACMCPFVLPVLAVLGLKAAFRLSAPVGSPLRLAFRMVTAIEGVMLGVAILPIFESLPGVLGPWPVLWTVGLAGTLRVLLTERILAQALPAARRRLWWIGRSSAALTLLPALALGLVFSAVHLEEGSLFALVLSAIASSGVLLAAREAAWMLPTIERMERLVPRWKQALAEQGLHAAAIPGAWVARGRIQGLSVRVSLVEDRVPMRIEVEVEVPSLQAQPALRIRGGRGDVPIGDLLLDRLVRVEGVSPDDARALLAGQHETLLPVLQGRPGSSVEQGRVRVEVEPPPVPIDGRPAGEWPHPVEILGEAISLARALEERARARLPAPR